MHQQLQNRLKELKTEFATGQKRLAELDAQRASLRETLLRISGAIQVLEEELGENGNHAVAAEYPQNAEDDEIFEAGTKIG